MICQRVFGFLLVLLFWLPFGVHADGSLEYRYGEAGGAFGGNSGPSPRNDLLRAGVDQAFGGGRASGTVGGAIGRSVPDPDASNRRIASETARATQLASSWDRLDREQPSTPDEYLAHYNEEKRLSNLLQYSKNQNPDDLRRWISTSPQFKALAGRALYDIRTATADTAARQSLQTTGEEAVALADQQFAADDSDSASFYYSVARAAADILVGIDPVTGTLRAVYESVTGINFVTNEPLNNVERGVAVFSVVTLGFAGDIAKGIQVFNVLITNVVKDSRLVGVAISGARFIAAKFAAFRGSASREASASRFIKLLVEASSGPHQRAEVLRALHETVETGAMRIQPELYRLEDAYVKNISLGEASRKEIDALGRAFVGENARPSIYRQDPTVTLLVSADGRRVYRGPILKKGMARYQANFETFTPNRVGRATPLSDAHINLKR